MADPFLIKLDESLSGTLSEPLRTRGYDVRTVLTQNWGGLPDDELWPRVVAEGAFFITADKGFGDIRTYRPGTHPGILVLRPDRESLPAYLELLDKALVDTDLSTLRGFVAVLTPRGIRIRRPASPQG